MPRYDVIVLGIGAVGAAATLQLARRGMRVLGIDRFAPPHALGSSHGDTRITRLAIGEGEHYTPLVRRSHEIWREIERETGAQLLVRTGGLIISSDTATASIHVPGFFRNTVAGAQKHGIAYSLLDAAEIRRRFPAFAVRDNEVGYFEDEAGYLRPEECIRSQLALAGRHGAELRVNECAQSFESRPHEIIVATDKGTYSADRLIVSVGAWLPQMLADARLASLFRVFRQVQYWFDPAGAIDAFLPPAFPVFVWEPQGVGEAIYGFPAIDGPHGGVKVASEQYVETARADAVARDVPSRDVEAMHRRFVAPYLPGLSARCVKTATCLYTVTPDAGFVVDALPVSERVLLASPCSGHGFKHSPAIGEMLADMAAGGRARFDIAPFAISRFAG